MALQSTRDESFLNEVDSGSSNCFRVGLYRRFARIERLNDLNEICLSLKTAAPQLGYSLEIIGG